MTSQALSLPAAPPALLVRLRAALADWLEQRRAARRLHFDLQQLAMLGERDLDDMGAPPWLRAQVRRYR